MKILFGVLKILFAILLIVIYITEVGNLLTDSKNNILYYLGIITNILIFVPAYFIGRLGYKDIQSYIKEKETK